MIAPNWALTAAHVVLTQTDVTLYPKVKIGGGSVFWKESMDSNFQSVEFETKNNVFVRKITQTWNELPWSGDGKSLLVTQLFVLGLITFFRYFIIKTIFVLTDIALIRFPHGKQLDTSKGKFVATIRMNFETSRADLNGEEATISGWGETESVHIPEQLSKAKLIIVPTTKAGADPNRILQLSQEGGVSVGPGDSGGKMLEY